VRRADGVTPASEQIIPTARSPGYPKITAGRVRWVVMPAAQELTRWDETNDRWPVSGRLANGQVNSMSSGQIQQKPDSHDHNELQLPYMKR
jgi:hypothetical protein